MEDENVLYAYSNYDLSLKDTPLPFDVVTVTPHVTRTHRLWHIIASAVQVIVITIMLALVLGIVLLFVLLPVLVPQR